MAVLVLSIAAAWLAAPSAPARDLKAAFGQEKAPYLWVEGTEVKGIEYDIVRAALAHGGNSPIPVVLPNRRVSLSLGSGEFDLVTGMQMDQAGKAFYSDEYLTYANFAVTRRADKIRLAGLADILRHSLAIWQNAWEDLDLSRFRPDGPNGLDYTEFPSQLRQTKFFWSGRCDVTVIDRNIFLWYSRQLSPDMDVSIPVEFHDILPPVRVRAAFRNSRDRDSFNAGLKALHASGDYERIFAKYGLTPVEKIFVPAAAR